MATDMTSQIESSGYKYNGHKLKVQPAQVTADTDVLLLQHDVDTGNNLILVPHASDPSRQLLKPGLYWLKGIENAPGSIVTTENEHKNGNETHGVSGKVENGGKLLDITPREIQQNDDVRYVNPKQYHRILKRRQARQKLIDAGKIPPDGARVKYLHESRHLHATKRNRGPGGRFTRTVF